MSRIFITGSSDGLGKLAGQLLIQQGHKVVLHARSQARADETKKALPKAEAIIVGDLSSIKQTKSVAQQVNLLGHFDAIIHNAGVGYQEPTRDATEDGLPKVFAVNTLAPYILTGLIEKPKRLIYLSSSLHQSGDSNLKDLLWNERRWQGTTAYSETKFHDLLIAFAVARLYPKIYSNALEPGWVPTKMGGRGAPDDLTKGFETQAWLAVSDEASALVSGEYFFHKKLRQPHSETRHIDKQNDLLEQCERISGVKL